MAACADTPVPDVEPDTVGVYNDTILERLDDLMQEVSARGIKLTVALHDRWSLGCWRSDAYQRKYNLTKVSWVATRGTRCISVRVQVQPCGCCYTITFGVLVMIALQAAHTNPAVYHLAPKWATMTGRLPTQRQRQQSGTVLHRGKMNILPRVSLVLGVDLAGYQWMAYLAPKWISGSQNYSD